MTLVEFFGAIAKQSGLVFVVTSMVAMGLSLTVLQIIAAFALGFVFGGRDQGIRSVMGLGTAQRNISAALVVGVQNFSDPNVITTLLVGAILLLLLLPTARQLGSRAQAPTPVAEPAAGS